MHSHTHIHTDAYTHTHTNTYTCTHTYTNAYTHANTNTHIHMYICMYIQMHTHMHKQSLMHVHTNTHMCTHTHIHAHTCTCIRTCAYKHRQTTQRPDTSLKGLLPTLFDNWLGHNITVAGVCPHFKQKKLHLKSAQKWLACHVPAVFI